MKINWKNLPFLILDVGVFYAALWAALKIRLGSALEAEIFTTHLKTFTIDLGLGVLIFFIIGLYDIRNFSKQFRFFRLFSTGVLAFFILSTFHFYLFPTGNITPKTILIMLFVFFGIGGYVLRELLRRYFIKSQPLANVVLVGDSEDIRELNSYIGENRQLGYRVFAWLKEYDRERVEELIGSKEVEKIVVPSSIKGKKELAGKFYEGLLRGVEIVGLSEFYESILGKVSIDEMEENWFLEKIRPKNGLYDFFKRGMDIFLASLVMILTLPFWPIIAFGIKLSSPGPVFYLKERIGAKENRFKLYKFRTMHETEGEAAVLKENFSAERGDEKRVFALGRLMRKLRVDEFPQVINVLKGEISFVGPRADFEDYYKVLKDKIPYYQVRTIIVPGLSGWAQIHDKVGSSVDNARERLAYDVYYVKNRSFLMDVAISLKTLKTILTLSGV